MTLELNATPEEVMRAVETLQELATAAGLPEKAIFGLSLALEECGSNIVHHALQHDARQKFHVTLEHDSHSFIVELRDRGPKFDPTAEAERKLQAEDTDPLGGWGIQLVRRYTDEALYTRVGDENILRLTKRFGSSESK